MLIKLRVVHLLVGVVCGGFIVAVIIHTTYVKELLEAMQALTITCVTIFTAYWTSKTFAHQPRTDETKEIISAIAELESAMSQLPMARLFQTIGESMENHSDNQKQVERIILRFKVASTNLFNLANNAIYLSASLKMRTMLVTPNLADEEELMTSETKRQELHKKLMSLRHDLISHTYFNLSDEWRRFRNYFKF